MNSATNSNNSPLGHSSLKCTVKLLTDGTTVGDVVLHNMDTGTREFGNTFDQTATRYWTENGSKVFQFVVYLHQEPSGFDFMFRMTFYDNGEPGIGHDAGSWELGLGGGAWIPLTGPEPVVFSNGNTQVHLPD